MQKREGMQMYTKIAVVADALGLHARPAAEFCRLAARFSSTVSVARPGGAAVSAKSIIKVLSQGFAQGTAVEISAEGDDEQEAVEALVALLEQSEKTGHTQ